MNECRERERISRKIWLHLTKFSIKQIKIHFNNYIDRAVEHVLIILQLFVRHFKLNAIFENEFQ